MTSETFLMIGFSILIALFVVMIAVGLPRGKRMTQTNERIEENQRKMMQISERQAAAMERIANSLETHR